MALRRVHYQHLDTDEVIRSETPLPGLAQEPRAELDVERIGDLLSVAVSNRQGARTIVLNREEALSLAAYIWGSYSE
mgnify:CR=1 FL=1